ncbi:hypothetical protein L2E82_34718 [Cichorium intybus]|uniref:Uncharacterized protein n=1 Tax=Cichorium intybus TaxID=13427 RepID=A0ACB9BMJ4_CICIN|nr:hypothetical protein L2E82_34718 [Cichorium intybus]
MLASNGVDENFEFGEWGPQWGMYKTEHDDEIEDDVSPEFSPEGPWNWNGDDGEKEGEVNSQDVEQNLASGSHNGVHDNSLRENNPINSHDSNFENNNLINVELGVPTSDLPDKPHDVMGPPDPIHHNQINGPMGVDTVDGSDHVRGQVGLIPVDSVELGHSVPAKTRSKSFDLNVNPSRSTSRTPSTWANREKSATSASDNSNASINQSVSSPPAVSLNGSQEIEATMGIGEKIGFQFEGNGEQMRSLLKRRGAMNPYQ